MSIFREFQAGARRHGAPVTVAVVAILAASFLTSWMSQGRLLGEGMVFFPSNALEQPWTFVSYAFGSAGNFIGVLFACLWLWGVGGMVERDIGSAGFAAFWLIMTLLGSLAYYAGYLLLGGPEPLFGPYVPLAATTVAWGTRYPHVQVLFMFVVRIEARWIAWISAGIVFFGTMNPRLAIFAISPLILAHLFAANKLPIRYGRSAPSSGGAPKAPRWASDKYVADVKAREKEREERERLRKLFESSVEEDDKR